MPTLQGVVVGKSKWGDCVEWRGAKNNQGYGVRRISRPRRLMTTAHRVAYQKAFGPIPDHLHVLHHCDNRTCMNLKHLFLGTRQDNMNDMKAKGRQNSAAHANYGESHGRTTLTWEQACEIRRQRNKPLKELAKRYSVGEHVIQGIRYKGNWSRPR